MALTRVMIKAVAVWGVALVGEALYAVLYPVPTVQEYDASTVVGDPDLPPLSICAVGDSTMTGAGLDTADDIWICQLASRLSDRFRVTITSHAVGGSTARDVRNDQLGAAVATAGDITFVSVGANDALRGESRERFSENLEAILTTLAATGTAVVISGVGDLGSIPRLLPPLDRLIQRRGRRFDVISATLAARHGAVKVDMWGLTAEQFRTLPGIFSSDRFHPTRLGHRIWADAAEVTIAPVVSRFA